MSIPSGVYCRMNGVSRRFTSDLGRPFLFADAGDEKALIPLFKIIPELVINIDPNGLPIVLKTLINEIT